MNTIPVSENVLNYIYLILPGFVYLIAIFVLLQAYTDNYLYNLLNKNKNLLPYIGILLVVFSFAAGYIIHLAFEFFIHLFHHQFYEEAKKISNVPERESRKIWIDTYAILVTIRHLFLSTLVLGISIWVWLRKNKKIECKFPLALRLKFPFLIFKKETRIPFIIYILTLVILLVAYCKEHQTFESMMKHYTEIKCEHQIDIDNTSVTNKAIIINP